MTSAPGSNPDLLEQVLQALRLAVKEELDRKRRLGHYAVLWRDGQVVLEGGDAPAPLSYREALGWAEPG